MSAVLSGTGYASPFIVRTSTYKGQGRDRGFAPRQQWDHETRSMALWTYGETGSYNTAARTTGIPPNTIRAWVENDPDGSVAQEIESLRLAVRANTAHKAAAWASRALDLLGHRMVEGDPVLDRHGNIRYLPVKAKDLSWIFSILTDKHALLTGMASQGKANASLLSLADKLLAAIAAQGAPSPPSAAAPSPQSEPLPSLDPGVLG